MDINHVSIQKLNEQNNTVRSLNDGKYHGCKYLNPPSYDIIPTDHACDLYINCNETNDCSVRIICCVIYGECFVECNGNY